MSGTLPKSEADNGRQTEKEKDGKNELNEDGIISPLPLSEDGALSVHESNGHRAEDEEEEEEEEEQEEEEEEEEPLPQGWSEETAEGGLRFYWYIRHGKVSFYRPRGEEESDTPGNDGSMHSQPQTARTNQSIPTTTRTQKTPGGTVTQTDRKKPQSVDQFERLLRDQMFNRQLKEAQKIGDKELLRAVVVRYEDSKPSGDEDERHDEFDDDCEESKEQLKWIDYYYYKLREQVLRGHWLQSITPAPGAAGKGQRGGRGRGAGGGRGNAREAREFRFYKLMEKFDRLTNLQQQQQRLEQEEDDYNWAKDATEREDAMSREDVVEDIDSILREIRRKPEPRRPPERSRGPTRGAPHRGQTGPHHSGPSRHNRPPHQDEDEDEDDEEDEEEAEMMQMLKRVRRFLHQQIDYVDQLGKELRPRDSSLPILAMDTRTMAEIRSYASPKPIVHRVMQAALLLIGYDEATTAVWGHCKSACVPDGRDGLNRRLMKFNVDDLHPFILQRSWKILHRIRLEDVQKASPGAATFYVWASGVLRMKGYSIDDDESDRRSNDEAMTQREIVRREQETIIRNRATTQKYDDDGYEGYPDERPSYPEGLYNVNIKG